MHCQNLTVEVHYKFITFMRWRFIFTIITVLADCIVFITYTHKNNLFFLVQYPMIDPWIIKKKIGEDTSYNIVISYKNQTIKDKLLLHNINKYIPWLQIKSDRIHTTLDKTL